VLLQRDYSFLRDINVWHPFVTIGVYSSTLSAAMSNLIGASRILYALARDDLFGKVLSPAKRTSRSGNPWVSVLISWFLVQLVLFSGKLNTIASIVTIFFLLVYAAVDLACLALEWASAPNFSETPMIGEVERKVNPSSQRPHTPALTPSPPLSPTHDGESLQGDLRSQLRSGRGECPSESTVSLVLVVVLGLRPTFRYFTWHTCVLGILGCAVMMFLINAIYASASIAFMLLLLLLIHYLSPTSSWGYISQALIFHQSAVHHHCKSGHHSRGQRLGSAAVQLTPSLHPLSYPPSVPLSFPPSIPFPTLPPSPLLTSLGPPLLSSPPSIHTKRLVCEGCEGGRKAGAGQPRSSLSSRSTLDSEDLLVRKYLLMLDVRKDHVKFWRPQVLLMVANPRGSTGLITFINDIKKSGLYVLGHVELGDLDRLPSDPLQSRYDSWLSLVDHLNIKAFVNLTLADSVRHGVQHLLFISGLGGMRPNTLVLGFYDDCSPEDKLQDPSVGSGQSADDPSSLQDPEDQPSFVFPALRGGEGTGKDAGKVLGPQEYVAVISDAVKMLKNVALARYFSHFDRAEVLGRRGGAGLYVDVWPVNLLRPDSSSYVDTCSLFLLQLACVLNMVRAWRRARLRLFLCVEEGRSLRGSEEKLGQLLKDLRISADVHTVPWDQVVALHWQRQGEGVKAGDHRNEDEEKIEDDGDYVNSFPSNTTRLSDEYLQAVNALVREQGHPPPAVRFLYLPRPPADTRRYSAYLHHLDLLTRDLGPTLLIH
ncbi:hypothetical protein JZ751_001916, partial [Albula glossodonta]